MMGVLNLRTSSSNLFELLSASQLPKFTKVAKIATANETALSAPVVLTTRRLETRRSHGHLTLPQSIAEFGAASPISVSCVVGLRAAPVGKRATAEPWTASLRSQ
jgi:hypothetical protein